MILFETLCILGISYMAESDMHRMYTYFRSGRTRGDEIVQGADGALVLKKER